MWKSVELQNNDSGADQFVAQIRPQAREKGWGENENLWGTRIHTHTNKQTNTQTNKTKQTNKYTHSVHG